MEAAKLCRCCLAEGGDKDLNTMYTWLEKIEIYSDMLLQCFNIVLNPNPECNFICELCINSLRASQHFKMQVLHSEQEFLKRIDSKQIDVKQELDPESDGNESDDYFLVDTIKQESPPQTPTKTEKNKTEFKKSTDDKYEIKNLVKYNSDLDNEPEESIKIVNKRKILKDYKMLSWTRCLKTKHRENLQTILKYSNAIPFKDKTLIGFLCGYCGLGYPDPKELRNHTMNEHEEERLSFKSSFDMSEYNVKLDINELVCNICMNKMENLKQLKEHLVNKHNKSFYNDIKNHMMEFKLEKGDIYNCAMCPSTYETFKMLKQHMNKHYSNYSCNKCETSFATKRSLNAHQGTHQEGSFKCDLCDKVFSSRSKKLYHEKTKHLGARSISNCPFCNTSFRSYYQRNQHLVKVHNSEAQYKCNVCSKGYILKSLLMCHIKKNHLMERNCQCTECGFRFFSKKALKAHMIKHSGEKKYACEVCHKAYARKYTLREHMRIHNNDRRFKCDVCGTAFVQKCSLKSHLLSHHGITMAASDIPIS